MALSTSEAAALWALGGSVLVLVALGLFELRAIYRGWRSGYGPWRQNLPRAMTEVRPDQWGRNQLRRRPPPPPRRAHWPVKHEGDSSFEGEQV